MSGRCPHVLATWGYPYHLGGVQYLVRRSQSATWRSVFRTSMDLHNPSHSPTCLRSAQAYPHHSHGLSTRFWPTGISVSHRNGRVPHDSDASRFWSKKSSSSQALSNCPATFHAVSLCPKTSPAQRLMLGLITESDRMKHKNTVRRYMYCVSQSPSTSALT